MTSGGDESATEAWRTVNVRRATDADMAVMKRLWDEFTAEASYTPYPGASFDPALLRNHVALVAEERGAVVGTVYANFASPHFGYVFGLYTCPGARRRGVARALMRAIAAVIRGEGRRYVVLSVDTPNEAARTFYDKLGFVDAARTLRADVDELTRDV